MLWRRRSPLAALSNVIRGVWEDLPMQMPGQIHLFLVGASLWKDMSRQSERWHTHELHGQSRLPQPVPTWTCCSKGIVHEIPPAVWQPARQDRAPEQRQPDICFIASLLFLALLKASPEEPNWVLFFYFPGGWDTYIHTYIHTLMYVYI